MADLIANKHEVLKECAEQSAMEQMSPEELAWVQELVSILAGCNADASRESSQATKQNVLLQKVGSMQGLPNGKIIVKSQVSDPRVSGPGGLRSLGLELRKLPPYPLYSLR